MDIVDKVNRYKVVLDNGLASSADMKVNWKTAKIGNCSENLIYRKNGDIAGKVMFLEVSDEGKLTGVLEVPKGLLLESTLELVPVVSVEYDMPRQDILENVKLLEVALARNPSDSSRLSIRQQTATKGVMKFDDDVVLPTVREEAVIRVEPTMISEDFTNRPKEQENYSKSKIWNYIKILFN